MRGLKLPDASSISAWKQLRAQRNQQKTSRQTGRLRPIHLALDFDGTLTERDTMSAFAKTCYAFQANRGITNLPDWSYFGDAYMKDYKAHEKHYWPRRADRKTLTEELEWLASLKLVEQASFQRVKDSGLFDSVADEATDWFLQRAKAARDDVTLRAGWFELIDKIFDINDGLVELEAMDSRIEIVSVNWSRFWITMCILSGYDKDLPENWDALEPLLAFCIANAVGECLKVPRIEWGAGAWFVGTEELNFTSNDKLKAYTSPVDCYGIGDPTGVSGIRIYAGDSNTDLECLIASHLPIVIHDEPRRSGQQELNETLTRLNIATKPLTEFDEEDRGHLLDRLYRGWPLVERKGEDVKLRSGVGRHRFFYTATDFTSLLSWIHRWHAEMNED